MTFLTDTFAEVPVRRPALPWLFPTLRADFRAKAVWYYGCASFGAVLRVLFTDGFLCTVLYRLMQASQCWWFFPMAVFAHKANVLLTGAMIGRSAMFGPGLVILHTVGLVINSSVRGGSNVILQGCITIGAEKGRSPVLGDHVFIGAGARVVGDIRVGNRVRIGANAVVVKDVPDDMTAVGVPARYIARGGSD